MGLFGWDRPKSDAVTIDVSERDRSKSTFPSLSVLDCRRCWVGNELEMSPAGASRYRTALRKGRDESAELDDSMKLASVFACPPPVPLSLTPPALLNLLPAKYEIE